MRKVSISRSLACRSGLISLPVMLGTLVVGCGDTFGPRWVDRVTIEPDSAHIEVGEEAVFTPIPRDQTGDPLSDEWASFVNWGLVGPSIVSLTVDTNGDLRVQGISEGATAIKGSLGRASPSFPVWVKPPGVASISFGQSRYAISSSAGGLVGITIRDTAGVRMDPRRFRISYSLSDTTGIRVNSLFSRSADTVSLIGMAQGASTQRLEGLTELTVVVNGDRAASTQVTVTAEPVGPREPPTALAVSADSIALSWRSMPQANDGYRVTRSPSRDEGYVEVLRRTADMFAAFDTTWVDASVQPATQYFYRIHGCNRFGCALFGSPPFLVSTPPRVDAAHSLTRATGGNQ